MIGVIILLLIIIAINFFPFFLASQMKKRVGTKELTSEEYTDNLLWIHKIISIISIILSSVAGVLI